MIEMREKLNQSRESEMEYLIHLPMDYKVEKDKKWPLILFLHGAGERGDNLESVKKYGIHRYINKNDIPFIVLSPQCPKDTFWDVHIKELKVLIEEAKQKFKVDHSKIYLVGISMGAYCTWNFAMQEPRLFSAIIPIAGGAMLPKYAERIKGLPIWAIHGEKDAEVPVEESRKIVNRLKAIGGNVKYTENPMAGHEICTTIFAEEQLYAWLLSQG